MPALGLAFLVLQGEGKDAIALLDSRLAVLLAGLERLIDDVEGGRRGELVCDSAGSNPSANRHSLRHTSAKLRCY